MFNSAFLSAIRGPLMLITLGVLFQIDQSGGLLFRKTWPVLLIVYAVCKLAEALAARRVLTPEGSGSMGGLR